MGTFEGVECFVGLEEHQIVVVELEDHILVVERSVGEHQLGRLVGFALDELVSKAVVLKECQEVL